MWVVQVIRSLTVIVVFVTVFLVVFVLVVFVFPRKHEINTNTETTQNK